MSFTPSNLVTVTEALRTKYWSWTIYESEGRGLNLLPFLIANLPGIDPNSWSERFDFGGVYVNGREVLGDIPLPLPCKVEYYEPKFDISHAARVFPEFKSDYIIYSDDHLIAIYKPPGLSSMPAKEQRHFSVKAAVEKLLDKTIHMPSRLDVSTQGLIILSASKDSHRGLQQAFERRQVKKEYLCASRIKPPWNQKEVNLSLARDSAHPVLRTIDPKYGQTASTTFTFVKESRSKGVDISVFKARPFTGRTHQIRVHAAASGIPLLGDRFYGETDSSDSSNTQLHLVSFKVELIHPVTKKNLRLTLPDSFFPEWIARIKQEL